MKIQKRFIIVSILVLFLPLIVGCLDFAQNKSSFEEKPMKTTYNGGRKITIIMQGVPIGQSGDIVNNILTQINIRDNEGGKE